MIKQRGCFSHFIASLPDFIYETDADWEMVVDYAFSQIGQPSMSEYAIIARVFDNTIAVSLN